MNNFVTGKGSLAPFLQMNSLFTSLLVFLLLTGCTSRQLYESGQAYQRNQCQQLPDAGERARCLGQTPASYEAYRRETGGGEGQP